MAEILTAAQADALMSVVIDNEGLPACYDELQAIAEGRHVVIPAEEYAALLQHSEDYANLHVRCFDSHAGNVFETIAELDSGLSSTVAERDRLAAELCAMKQAISDPENQPSQYGTVLASEYDRIAGINQQMLEALTVLLMEAETFSVSGVYFTEPCMQHKGPALAHAAIAAATRGREE